MRSTEEIKQEILGAVLEARRCGWRITTHEFFTDFSCCPIGALGLKKGAVVYPHPGANSVNTWAASFLGTDEDWVESFICGIDGEPPSDSEPCPAFLAGRWVGEQLGFEYDDWREPEDEDD